MSGEPSFDTNDLWKQHFRTPYVLGTTLASLAPTRGLATSNRSGVMQLYAWDVPSGNLAQLTHDPEGTLFGMLSSDGRYVYYHEDKQGNEIGHYVRVPFEGGAPEDIAPDLPLYASYGVITSRQGNQLALSAATDEGIHIYCIDVQQNGHLETPRAIYRGKRAMLGFALSSTGEMLVLGSTEQSDTLRARLLVLDTTNGQPVRELSDGPESSVEPVQFSPVIGDVRLLATTDRTGVKRPLLWNALTGERTDIALDELEGEVVPLSWSADGNTLLLCHFVQAVQHLYIYNLTANVLTRLEHPTGSFLVWSEFGTYFGPNGEVFAQWQDSTHHSQVIALDAKTGTMTRVVLDVAPTPPGRPWHSIYFPSSDGHMIQGWLALPEGEGPFPTILEMHGGPSSVQTEVFSASSQAWLDKGYAYCSINYRGSITFGRAFQQQIWGNIGHWELEDMVAARTWLVKQNIAQPDAVVLTGWSYGGYLTLLGLGKRPELWAGGMAGVAIADWAVQYEDAAETLRGFIRGFFGGTPAEKAEQYAISSPITYAENVRAPILIIQGRNDTRTPARPIELYEEKLRALGKEIEVSWFDAGHVGAAAQIERGVQSQEQMLRFASRILKRTYPQ